MPSLSFYFPVRRISSNFSNFNFCILAVVLHDNHVRRRVPFSLRQRAALLKELRFPGAALQLPKSNFNLQLRPCQILIREAVKVRPLNAGFYFYLQTIAAGTSHCKRVNGAANFKLENGRPHVVKI